MNSFESGKSNTERITSLLALEAVCPGSIDGMKREDIFKEIDSVYPNSSLDKKRVKKVLVQIAGVFFESISEDDELRRILNDNKENSDFNNPLWTLRIHCPAEKREFLLQRFAEAIWAGERKIFEDITKNASEKIESEQGEREEVRMDTVKAISGVMNPEVILEDGTIIDIAEKEDGKADESYHSDSDKGASVETVSKGVVPEIVLHQQTEENTSSYFDNNKNEIHLYEAGDGISTESFEFIMAHLLKTGIEFTRAVASEKEGYYLMSSDERMRNITILFNKISEVLGDKSGVNNYVAMEFSRNAGFFSDIANLVNSILHDENNRELVSVDELIDRASKKYAPSFVQMINRQLGMSLTPTIPDDEFEKTSSEDEDVAENLEASKEEVGEGAPVEESEVLINEELKAILVQGENGNVQEIAQELITQYIAADNKVNFMKGVAETLLNTDNNVYMYYLFIAMKEVDKQDPEYDCQNCLSSNFIGELQRQNHKIAGRIFVVGLNYYRRGLDLSTELINSNLMDQK